MWACMWNCLLPRLGFSALSGLAFFLGAWLAGAPWWIALIIGGVVLSLFATVSILNCYTSCQSALSRRP